VDLSAARKRLEEIRDDLDRSLAVLRGEHTRDRGESSSDAADAGAILSESDRNQAMTQTVQAQRAQVMAALARLEGGNYGACVDCAQPVPEGRLEARPEAERCIPCQSKHDRRHR
jgi:DnaK suppressor protein